MLPFRWFCNGSVYTDGSVIHTNGSVMVLYIQNNVLYTEPDGSTAYETHAGDGPFNCRADSASLVQRFSTLCCLYLIKIVERMFLGGYFVLVKFIVLMEGVT